MDINKSLCWKCKYFIAEDYDSNCGLLNMFERFCEKHHIEADVSKCKYFKSREETKEVNP